MKPQISKEKEILLVREASMASMAIGIGLTHIRKSDFVQPGFFYSGFYSYTTGLERLMKLIVICDYRVKNAHKFPNNKQLKAFGHKISDLFRYSRQIKNDFDFDIKDQQFSDDHLYEDIIIFLSDFATQSRYYNLDVLTGRNQNNIEPYQRWDNTISKTIVKRHYRKNKKRLEKKLAIAQMMDEHTFTLMRDENGQGIHNLVDFYSKGDTVSIKQKYSMFYLYEIIRFLSDLLAELHYQGHLYPILQEFFTIFRNDDKAYVINKKSWNPNPPYRF